MRPSICIFALCAFRFALCVGCWGWIVLWNLKKCVKMSLSGLRIWYCENMFLFLWSIIPTNRNESTKSYHLNLRNRSVSVDLTMKKTLKNIWNLYYDGFKNMTWGRPLWLLIFLKVIILFLVLRMFFFKPVLSGKDEAEKIEYVGEQLSRTINNNQ